jgi:enediyne biosynthesis protein E3
VRRRARTSWHPGPLVIALPDLGRIGRRLGARVLHKDPHPPLERFGFHLREAASRERVAGIIEAFFTGYNAALEESDPASIERRCAALPPVLHPFAFEGSGMGYGARGLLDPAARASRFPTHVETVRSSWEFMYYVGLGIWTAFLGRWQTGRAARALDGSNLVGLLYDGVGFQRGFFHRPRNPRAHTALEGLPEDARAQAFRGFGRSLWFVYRDDREGLLAAVEALPVGVRGATIVGIGLAVCFTGVDDLAQVLGRLETFPDTWRRDLERGLRLALYVRHRGQPAILESWITASGDRAPVLRAHLEHAVRARASTCDRPRFLVEFTDAC